MDVTSENVSLQLNYRAAPAPVAVVLTILLFAMIATGARGEITSGAATSPQPVPITVRVPRGGSVEIPLRAFGSHREQLGFRIRSAPAHGELSSPKRYGRETASVTYNHSGDAGHEADKFTYAIQSSGGISAPATVHVEIIDQAAVFVVPESHNFGEVLIGTAAQAEITIENRGGGMVRGVARVEEPWRTENGSYELGPGEQQRFTVIFHPETEQTYAGTLLFDGNIDRSTALRGSGLPPVAVQPERLTLKAEAGQITRRAALNVYNRTNESQVVQIAVGENLQAPDQIDLEPKTARDITVTTETLNAINTDVFLRAPGFQLRVPVDAPVIGPILAVEPKSLSLGARAKPDGEAELKVLNTGGSRAFIRAKVEQPFQLLGKTKFSLQPGEQAAVRVGLHSDARPGKHRTWVALESEHQSLEVPIEAELVSQVTHSVATPLPSPTAARAAVTPEPKYSNIPAISEIRVERVGPRDADISWKSPAAEPLQFRIERRFLSVKDDQLQVRWAPVEKGRVEQNDTEIRARLFDLQPGGMYSLRILSVDQTGELSHPSRVITFQTPPKPRIKITALKVLLLTLAGLIIAIGWQRYKARLRERTA
jgi:hypothetical protein